MKRLFAKIFLWFWVTGTLTGIASVLAVVVQHHPMRRPSLRVFQDTASFYGTGAVDVYEERGAREASDYIMELSKNTRIQGCIFDEAASPMVGEYCAQFQQLATQATRGEVSPSIVSHNSAMTAMKVKGASGRAYIFTSGLITGPHAPPTYDLGNIALRGAIAVLVSGLICYFLTRFLTDPILLLRTVAQRITAGNLSVRVEGPMTWRGDELGDFARDFNRMADQTEHLIHGQRQLLYDVSHELRSPLARMTVALNILRRRMDTDSVLDRMHSDLQQLSEMIGRILTVAKLESLSSLPSPTHVALSELIASVAHDADFEAQEKRCSVDVIAIDDATIVGDQNLIRSAIENVIRNAVRFAVSETAVEVRLKTSEREGHGSALISIRDHGPGVPEEELPYIFNAFYRVTDSGSRSSKGVGLGLSITERIVRLHKGRIRALNLLDGGLQVEIELPLASKSS